jgi:hypothetical protein
VPPIKRAEPGGAGWPVLPFTYQGRLSICTQELPIQYFLIGEHRTHCFGWISTAPNSLKFARKRIDWW